VRYPLLRFALLPHPRRRVSPRLACLVPPASPRLPRPARLASPAPSCLPRLACLVPPVSPPALTRSASSRLALPVSASRLAPCPSPFLSRAVTQTGPAWKRSDRLYGHVEEGHVLEGRQDPHWLGPGSLRRLVCRPREGPTGGGHQELHGWSSHHLHGRASGHLENDLRRSGTRAEIRPRGQETHRRPPRQRTERADRDPVVPAPSGDRRQRGRPSSPPTSRTHTESSNSRPRTRTVQSAKGNSPCRAYLPTSSAASPSRKGQT